MAVVATPIERTEKSGSRSEYCIELGILNNMPDAALERTERQFFSLLGAAAPDLLVRVRFFSLSTFERQCCGREHTQRQAYARATDLPNSNLDALIVTGTEPREPHLPREGYWNELTQVFKWIADDGPPTLFSCLAAHAAVLHYSGIERHRLEEKRFGIFKHVVSERDALTQDLSSPIRIAHSRWNELAESDLVHAGYRILTWSSEAGAELFVKRDRTDLLFCQGHPEYDEATLAREFRRDVRRYLAGDATHYPALPKYYFSASEIVALDQFRLRVQFARNENLMAEFPALASRYDSRSNAPGATILRAWLQRIVEKKRATRLTGAITAAPTSEAVAA